MQPDKLVFKFESSQQELAVKFVKGNYGEEVHKCLAQKGRAPELHEVCKLPLNWKAVVMQSASVVSSWPNDYIAQLNSILAYLQEKNYVHGDLREPNILNVQGILQLFDFDWAGKEYTARYPFTINHKDIVWPREKLAGKCILKADDTWWIEQLIKGQS